MCSTEYWPLLPKTSLELDFYHYYFDSYEFTSNPKVTSSSSTNSHKRVKQSSFEKLRLPVPPLPEQRRIADILSTVDEKIQQTDKIIETTEELKHGLMQDAFVQGLYEEDRKIVQIGPKEYQIPSSWDVINAGEVCDQITVGIVSGATDHYRDDGVPFIRTKNIKENDIDTNDMKHISPEFHQENLGSELNAGDVITARTGEPGTTCVVPPEYDGANCFSLLISRTGDELDGQYFSYALVAELVGES